MACVRLNDQQTGSNSSLAVYLVRENPGQDNEGPLCSKVTLKQSKIAKRSQG